MARLWMVDGGTFGAGRTVENVEGLGSIFIHSELSNTVCYSIIVALNQALVPVVSLCQQTLEHTHLRTYTRSERLSAFSTIILGVREKVPQDNRQANTQISQGQANKIWTTNVLLLNTYSGTLSSHFPGSIEIHFISFPYSTPRISPNNFKRAQTNASSTTP